MWRGHALASSAATALVQAVAHFMCGAVLDTDTSDDTHTSDFSSLPDPVHPSLQAAIRGALVLLDVRGRVTAVGTTRLCVPEARNSMVLLASGDELRIRIPRVRGGPPRPDSEKSK